MDHVAIDLGSRKSQICVRAADGQIVDERRWEQLCALVERRWPERIDASALAAVGKCDTIVAHLEAAEG